MHEIIVNLHMHTTYSDGHLIHAQIADAGLRAGIDAVIVTDHNVYVQGMEQVYQQGDRRLVMLIGEEIHNQARLPQKNHLLVFGVRREMAIYADDPQRLIDLAHAEGGLSFIAHPLDPASETFHEPDISWEDWQVEGFTGLELWNGLSEFKSRLKSKFHGAYYAFNPQKIGQGPFPQVIQRWDELLAKGMHPVAIGGSDAHALPGKMGPLKRTLFPFEFHFKAINTHLILPGLLTGKLEIDRGLILEAMRQGWGFVGYDLPSPTFGFRFFAQGIDRTALMGETISAKSGVTLQIRLPIVTECNLLRNGKIVRTWNKRTNCTHITSEPGIYRVEAYIQFLGQRRGWIFSNPIYVIK